MNILDRNLNLNQHYLLEASAGTGKTFSIENLVVRLLLELPSCTIDRILVVTFTRAATRELKIRIRDGIRKALDFFLEKTSHAPDYLVHLVEKGDRAAAIQKLKAALACFDDAAIFTIHGFCQRMLSENRFDADIGVDLSVSEGMLTEEQVIRVIRNFFRSGLKPGYYSSQQLNIVLKQHKHDIGKLESALSRLMLQGMSFADSPVFDHWHALYEKAVAELAARYAPIQVLDDLLQMAPCYKETCDKQGRIKSEFRERASALTGILTHKTSFDQLLEDGLSILEILDPSNRKAKAATPSLHYPDFIDTVRQNLLPLVQEASNYLTIFTRMARDCRLMLERYVEAEDRFHHDDLLKAMKQAVQQPHFARSIRNRFDAAVVDEFQDTDEWQWAIFEQLFFDAGTTRLYLVGDPKQSIYGFRNADIYTYLKAAERLGPSCKASLDTNYRSQAPLVEALNALFAPKQDAEFLTLPRLKTALPYTPVKASQRISPASFGDDRGCVHVCLAQAKQGRSKKWPTEDLEQTTFFPFIADEILRLKEVAFGRWAILVKDRFQAERAASYLRKVGIPTLKQRQESLAESAALPALKDILLAVRNPQDCSAFKLALGGKIIQWNLNKVAQLTEEEEIRVQLQLQQLRKTLHDTSFALFFQDLMNSQWDHPLSLGERLLAEADNLIFYQELQQLAEWIMDHQSETGAGLDKILQFMEEIQTPAFQEDERILVHQDLTQDAVRILTLHTSKGLEFDFVFALGLASRTKRREEPIPVADRCLQALPDSHPQVDKYYQELDAEKMRQLYVGMTRAKYRLYLPVAVVEDRPKKLERGEASPMELFLANRRGKPDDYSTIVQEDGQDFVQFLDSLKNRVSITYSWINSQDAPTGKIEKAAPRLKQPKEPSVPGDPSFIYSFSSLAHHIASEPKDPPHNFLHPSQTVHTLPSGSETGTLLHRILEKIDFRNAHQIPALVASATKGTPFENWNEVIADMMRQTLHTPLIGNFSLSQAKHLYREMEFLYPYRGEDFPSIREFTFSDGALKGVIDLIFEWEGRYYLLDWKSNWLGPSPDYYGPDQLKKAFQENRYDLQAAIYTQALERYLKLVDPRPFNECFGGTFYLFLRGLQSGSQTGIYFERTAGI